MSAYKPEMDQALKEAMENPLCKEAGLTCVMEHMNRCETLWVGTDRFDWQTSTTTAGP